MSVKGWKEWSGLVTGKQGYPISNGTSLASAVDRGRWVVRGLWLAVSCSVLGMALFLPFGWDTKYYLLALHGQAPLAYSPLFAVPVVGVARLLPFWLTAALFGFAYFSGWLTQLWAGMQCATPDERRILRYVAPVIAFFPCLLVSDVIASGNLAYILYGLILGTAALGWKRGHWNWFYLAVLAAACAKVQLLTMLAIPLLCGRRQWMRSILAGAAGVSLYALQSRIMPQAFHAYMSSVKILSGSRRDFGCAPVGNLARLLQDLGMAYVKPCIAFYVAYALGMFLILYSLSRLYRERRVRFESWAPVMLLGVVLLNPRILPYDFAAVSLPVALVAWRTLRGDGRKPAWPRWIGAALVLLALNVFMAGDHKWAPMVTDELLEMSLLLAVFGGGVRGLLREAAIGPLTSRIYGIESIPESELVS